MDADLKKSMVSDSKKGVVYHSLFYDILRLILMLLKPISLINISEAGFLAISSVICMINTKKIQKRTVLGRFPFFMFVGSLSISPVTIH